SFKAGMDNLEATDESSFSVDEVSNIIKESVEDVIGTAHYSHNKVGQWTSSVIEQCVNQLTRLGKPFKYIVTCLVMQKNGAGLNTASSCYWDSQTDGSCIIKWENKSMYVIVSVFGLAMAADAVGDDFCLRGLKTELRQPQLQNGSSGQTLQASHVTFAKKTRDPREARTSATNTKPKGLKSPRRHEAREDLQQHRLSNQRSPVPPEEDRWYLKAPRYLVTGEYPVNRLDGLPERPVATPDERREGLLGGLLAASDISRTAALTGKDRQPAPASDAQRPARPVDFDPLAAVHFPATLGASYRLREQIEAAGTAGTADPRLTFSPPGSGLPYPPDPWRLRTPHNADDFVPTFRSVGDHLADALPAARQQRQLLMAETAPDTAAAEVFVSLPYSVELARLRMQRLRIEEELLLEVKRQQQLEETAPPKSKWFELRTPQFHYEAHKNNQLVRGGAELPEFDDQLLEFRRQLASSSEKFKETFDAYARLQAGDATDAANLQ
uniref:Protein kinase domain-containing protein n=1 Tax=Macrostomum lignano TaxID=282301 RepID=A0A1I8HD51_9PLAT